MFVALRAAGADCEPPWLPLEGPSHRSIVFGDSLPQVLVLYNVPTAGEYTDKSSLTRTDTPSRSPGGVP